MVQSYCFLKGLARSTKVLFFLVEKAICEGILGLTHSGEIPEWSKGADCKSADIRLRRFESYSRHHYLFISFWETT